MRAREEREEMKRILTFHGTNPAPGVLASSLSLPEDEAQMAWKDFMRSVYVPKGSAQTQAKRPRGRPRKHPVVHVDAPVVEHKSPARKKGIHAVPADIIRGVCAVVGLVVLVRSVMFNHSYFSRTDDEWVAWIMALSMSAILYTSAQIAIEGWVKRNMPVLLSSVVVFLAFVFVNIYITSDVLGAAREAVVTRTEQGHEDVQTASRMIPVIAQDLSDKRMQEAKLQEERTILLSEQKSLDPASPTYQKDYLSARNRLVINQQKIEAKTAEIDANTADLKKYKATPGLETTLFTSQGDRDFGKLIDRVFAFGLDVVGPWLFIIAIFLE